MRSHRQDYVGVAGKDARAADAVDGLLARLVPLREVGPEHGRGPGLGRQLLDLVEQARDVAGVVFVCVYRCV